MPMYTYRREDGTEFDIRQSFAENALTVDPATGQKVVRVMQPAGIIFKGSGFYVTDSKSNNPAKPGANKRHEDGDSGPARPTATAKRAQSPSHRLPARPPAPSLSQRPAQQRRQRRAASQAPLRIKFPDG